MSRKRERNPDATAPAAEVGGPERRLWRDAVAIAALLLLAVIVLWPVIAAGDLQAPGLPGLDGRTQWYPWRAYAAHWLKQGVLPLWNPHVLCGTPFVGNVQSALFYPPNLLFVVMPIHSAARLSVALHIALSLFLTYVLARRMGAGRMGAALAAMAFGFGSAQLLRVTAGHWGVLCATPWLPLIALSVWELLRRPTATWTVIGAAAVAMQVLSGVPQYVFISAVAAAVIVVFLSPYRTMSVKRIALLWAVIAGMFLLGAAAAGVQLLPAIEAAQYGARSLPMRREWIELFSLDPQCLMTLVRPRAFGGAGGAPWTGPFLLWEMNGYFGIAALAMAAAGLCLKVGRGLRLRLAGVAVLLLLLALGKHTPLLDVAMSLPMAGMFRGAAKFLLPFQLVMALLAGLGLNAFAARIAAKPPHARWASRAAFAVCLLAAVDMIAFGRSFVGIWTNFRCASEALPQGVWDYLRTQGPNRRVLTLNNSAMNDAMLGGFYTVEGIEPNPPARYHELFRAAQGMPPDVAPSLYQVQGWGRLPGLTGLSRITAPQDVQVEIPGVSTLLHTKDGRVLEATDVPLRAYVVYAQVSAPAGKPLLDATLRHDPKREVVLEAEREGVKTRSERPAAPARIREEGPNHLVVEATAQGDAGWLVLSDAMYPGWIAEVDGKATPILSANYAFRAVALPPGEHTVVFRYAPKSLRWGFALSLAGLAVCGGLMVVAYALARRAQ